MDDNDKQRLDRLLYRWEKREGSQALDKNMLRETRARLQPGFDEAGYAAYVRKKKEKEREIKEHQSSGYMNGSHQSQTQPVPVPPSIPPTLSQLQSLQQRISEQQQQQKPQMPQAYAEHQYLNILYQTAQSLLKEKQSNIPEDAQVTLDYVKSAKQELYVEVNNPCPLFIFVALLRVACVRCLPSIVLISLLHPLDTIIPCHSRMHL